ncbi:MAG TPA: nitroreductase [Ktedonobacteraceae bacterium]|jgi:nitroreductase|nr:nitroreductase [Ktedonobacteraceae bacterium]
MSVFETIQRRHSIGQMTDQVPTRAQIEQLLVAATHAPNHRKVEPWRFFVLAGKAREELGSIMAASLAERMRETSSEKAQTQLAKERNKPLRSPILIVVAAEAPRQANVLAIENIEAVAAAVENMLLTAEEIGLAAIWRTGDAVTDPRVKAWLGLSSEDHIVSILYLGYAAMAQPERTPRPISEKTAWLGWEE